MTDELRSESSSDSTLTRPRPRELPSAPKKEPFEHQSESIRRLKAEFALCQKEKKELRGLLVLPTGTGKTLTAVRWIVTDLPNTGKCALLWLAHRDRLLENCHYF